MDEIKEKIIAWREARKVCFAIEPFDSFDKKHADKLAVSMVAWKQLSIAEGDLWELSKTL